MAEIAGGRDPGRARQPVQAVARAGSAGSSAQPDHRACSARRARRSAGRCRRAAPIWSASAGRNCSCRPRAAGSRPARARRRTGRAAEHHDQRAGGRGGAGAEGVGAAGGAGGAAGACCGRRIEVGHWLAPPGSAKTLGTVKRFDPRYWTVNFPRPMMASAVTTGPARAPGRDAVLPEGRPGRADLGGGGPVGSPAAGL